MYIPIAFGNGKQSSNASKTVLAGDIGATKTNLALLHFTGEKFLIKKENRYTTKDFKEVTEMIREFLGDDKMPDAMCFGVAGPVQNGSVKVTNVDWQLDNKKISGKFSNIPIYLINDLEATAYGLAALEKDDIRTVYESGNGNNGNIALIAPGTGLGEAGLYWDGESYHPFATEGGHCDFAPRTEFDAALYFYLHKKLGHVSWERLISGNGIIAIYDFLHTEKKKETPAWLIEKMQAYDPAAVISENAKKSEICGETMNVFLRYLAFEASNLALKLKATGGVFIGGGIMPKILELVRNDDFLEWFRDSGRMKSLLEKISLKIILNEKTALLGAAFYGAFEQ